MRASEQTTNRYFLLFLSAFVVGSIGIEAVCFTFRDEAEITRFWHLYPIGLAALGWSMSCRDAQTDRGVKICSVLAVVFFTGAVTTPSVLYGFYNLGRFAPTSGTPDKIQPDVESMPHEGLQELPTENLNLRDFMVNHGPLTFADSLYGTCTFQFQKDGKVVFDSFAYSTCKYEGTFREEGGVILISIDTFYENVAFLDGRTDPDVVRLPALKLQQSSQGLVLIRKDGRTDFNEHWNIYPLLDGETVFPFRNSAVK